MRRIGILILGLVLLWAMAFSAYAVTGASKVESFATVSPDGSCQVSLTATFHMEEAVSKVYFPIPADASGVTVNGSRVITSRSGDERRVDLSRLAGKVVGDVTVNIHYSLHDVIHATDIDSLELRLPLLNGFAYPVESLSFSVTMPGPVEVLPSFVSGYHQTRIEEYLSFSTEGATVSGYSLKGLKDHETLTMHLNVTSEMFPQSITQTQNYDFGITAMGICAALAFVYWLIAMWNLPVWPQKSTEPPHGYTAGQLGCIVAGQGADLTGMVFSWAQLGYVLIRRDRRGRVVLQKRMEMGNERSDFELRSFQKLFGKKDTVDTSGVSYAALCRQLAKRPAGVQDLLHSRTGNPLVFRVLASGIGLFGGAGLAVALANGAALQGLFLVLLGAAGAYSGWYLQTAGAGILLQNWRRLLPCGILSAAWLLLSLSAGAFQLGLWLVLGSVLAGLLLAWGGRRTDFGRQSLAQIFGLRRYLRSADKLQLQRICATDPDYFFRLAPYAMALGADTAFAKRFGKTKLSGCPYLTVDTDVPMTALRWCALMRSTAAAMNARAAILPLERFIRFLKNLTR